MRPIVQGTVVQGVVVAQPGASAMPGIEMAVPAGEYPPLIEMTRRFEADLRITGTTVQVVDQACKQLGVNTAGLSLTQKAERAHDAMYVGGRAASSSGAPPAASADAVAAALIARQWSAGKPGGGPEAYGANPWRFSADHTFVTERDGCNGTWAVRFEEDLESGTVVLRMDWRAGQAGNYAEFVLQPRGVDGDPAFRARGSSYGFMRSWAIVQRQSAGAPSADAAELIPSAAIDGCYTFPCGVIRWCSLCEGNVWGAYLGVIPPFLFPLVCYFRQGCGSRSAPPHWPPTQTKSPNYYFELCKGPGDGGYILVKDRDTIEFGIGCGGACAPTDNMICCECKRS